MQQDENSPAHDPDRHLVGERRYRLLRLLTAPAAGQRLVGALVLPDELPVSVPWQVLYAMAERLESSDLDAAGDSSVSEREPRSVTGAR